MLPNETAGIAHDCVGNTSVRVLPRPDLTDEPLNYADTVMFVDGSCKKNIDRTITSDYAVVTLDEV